MTEDQEPDPLKLARDIADAYRGDARKKPRNRQSQASSSRPAGSRGSREDAVLVSGVMRDLVQQQGWEAALAGTRVFSEWSSIVGPQVAQHTRVEHFADGVVHISAASTAWAKELTLLAPNIVAKLNERLGEGQVMRIEVKGPQAYSWKSGPRSVKGRGPRDTYG